MYECDCVGNAVSEDRCFVSYDSQYQHEHTVVAVTRDIHAAHSPAAHCSRWSMYKDRNFSLCSMQPFLFQAFGAFYVHTVNCTWQQRFCLYTVFSEILCIVNRISLFTDITVLKCSAARVCHLMSPHLPPDVTSAATLTVFFGTTSKLTFCPNHFLTNCFRFLVLYTVYSSGLAVLYLGHSK